MLANPASQSVHASAVRTESRVNCAPATPSRPFLLRSVPSGAWGCDRSLAPSDESYSALRRWARKTLVREAMGYGAGGEAKRVVLAVAWGVSEQRVAVLLSLSSAAAITDATLERLPEPQRSQVLAAERWLDGLSVEELRAWVVERRGVVVTGRRAA